MATKPKNDAKAARTFVQNIGFEEDFLFYNLEKCRWCTGRKVLEDVNAYHIRFYDCVQGSYEMTTTYVGKQPDEMDDYLRSCTKLGGEPTHD